MESTKTALATRGNVVREERQDRQLELGDHRRATITSPEKKPKDLTLFGQREFGTVIGGGQAGATKADIGLTPQTCCREAVAPLSRHRSIAKCLG